MNEYITLKQNHIYSIDHSKPLSQEWISLGENILKLENFLKENMAKIFLIIGLIFILILLLTFLPIKKEKNSAGTGI